jgi:hypothetical protein
VHKCVRADGSSVRKDALMPPHRRNQRPRGRNFILFFCIRADAARVHAVAAIYSRGNFITDVIVRLSHERPSSHRPCPRPSIRPPVLIRPLDKPWRR